MTRNSAVAGLAAGIAARALLGASEARAQYVININQVGSNIEVTGSGTISTNGLSEAAGGNIHATIAPQLAAVFVGNNEAVHDWGGLTGPLSIGTGAQIFTSAPDTPNAVGLVWVSE